MADDAPPDHPPDTDPSESPPRAASDPDKANKSTGTAFGDPGDRERGGAERDPVGDDRSENEAYRRGRESFRSTGNTASASRSKVKNIIGGNYYNNKTSDSSDKKTSWLLRPKMLDQIRLTFAGVADYERMRDTVSSTRVIVLRGCAGTGMKTTAVRLLDEVAAGKVAWLDSPDGVGSIREKDLGKKRGYVVRLTSVGPRVGPTELELDALAELLNKRKCWCVLVDSTSGDQGARSDYVFDYLAPDYQDVLRNHVAWRLGPDDAEKLTDALRVAEDDRVHAALGAHRTLGDLVRLAELLVEHVRGALEFEDVVVGCVDLVAEQMVSWFACLRHVGRSTKKSGHEHLALAAFRIALAVLNISTYHQVATAARQLEADLVAAIDPAPATKALASISLDRQTALTSSRARLCPGVISFGVDAVVDGELVRYLDDRFPIAVLDHVWSTYNWLRAPLVKWLTELGRDYSAVIWVRAAQAAGALAGIDFSDGFPQLISPNVYAETIQERRFAAVALDQASQDERSHNVVTEFLRRWRTGSEGARWTAAATHGYGQGLDDIDATLDALRVLGTPDETLDALDDPSGRRVMITVVSRSLSSLLAFGAVEPILATLNDWARHERTSMRTLTGAAVLQLVRKRGFHFTYLDISGGRDYRDQLPRHGRWPLLLALQHENPPLTTPIARLLRAALRGNGGDRVTDALQSWLAIAARDPSCLSALIEFLPQLVEIPSDSARLLHLVTERRRDWAEPLRPEVADALEIALHSASTWEVHRWTTSTIS
ncbi:MAG TPA: hypothetical protein VGJ45_22130 [Pseudonocardiaceae bacterium]|jgi:hypothetical protein